MNARLITAALTLCWTVLLTAQTFAQVKINLPKYQFKPTEQIDVAITNKGKQAVSFCVEFGQWSHKSKAEPLETTPTPAFIQKRTHNVWSVLLIGPDIGSSRHTVTLLAGKTQHYPIRVSDTGRMRMVLNYWSGESNADCANPPPSKAVRSKEFLVQ